MWTNNDPILPPPPSVDKWLYPLPKWTNDSIPSPLPFLSGQMTLPHPLWMSILRYENIAKNPHTYLCLTFLLMKKQKQAIKSQASSYEKENPKPSKCLTTWANLLGQFPSNRIHVPAMFLGEGDLLSVTWLVANKVNKVQWIVPPEFKYC